MHWKGDESPVDITGNPTHGCAALKKAYEPANATTAHTT
jgi:hypothetical protein